MAICVGCGKSVNPAWASRHHGTDGHSYLADTLRFDSPDKAKVFATRMGVRNAVVIKDGDRYRLQKG